MSFKTCFLCPVLLFALFSYAQALEKSHTTATLLTPYSSIQAGKSFDVGVLLTMEPGWHTYWKNPGDSGFPTKIAWTLPSGFTAGPIRWPTPERIGAPPFMNYGYDKQVLLLTTINWPKSSDIKPGDKLEISAKVSWLECEEGCQPGSAVVTLSVPVSGTFQTSPRQSDLFSRYGPAPRSPEFPDRLNFEARERGKGLRLYVTTKKALPAGFDAYFFADKSEMVESAAPQKMEMNQDGFTLDLQRPPSSSPLAELSGVLVVTVGTKTSSYEVLASVHSSGLSQASMDKASAPLLTYRPSTNALMTWPAVTTGSAQFLNDPSLAFPVAGRSTLLLSLFFAFLGGIILNLMPCVLPVLSLKVLSLVRQAGEESRSAWKQGVAFSAGVLLSFWLLAGILLSLRAAGHELGWGFQMQSPVFIMALSVLFFVFALNLFGVFEIGTSLAGIDSVASRRGGMAGSFGMGALATIAATPCTAPFMGAALGFAVAQSPFVAFLVFTFLAVGMVSPYLLLSFFPALLRFVPKPGAWMESFKQFLGFLLLGTVIFLLWVFGQELDVDALAHLLAALLFIGVGAWIYGRWTNPVRAATTRLVATLLAALCVLGGTAWGVRIASSKQGGVASVVTDGVWEPYSAGKLAALRLEGKPVFIDFTAAWCINCKVNEAITLNNEAVRRKFAEKGVVLMKADWTRQDPEITRALAEFNRNAVPLYVLYGGEPNAVPQILPEALTPGIVLEALDKLK